RLTTATLNIFVTCWFTLIVKLLPSICYFPWVSTAFSRRERSHSYCWLRHPQKRGGTRKLVVLLVFKEVIQETGLWRSAILACCRDFHQLRCRLSGMRRVFLHIAARVSWVPVGREQLRMIKRCSLGDRAWICQPIAQEVNQVLLFLQRESDRSNIRIHNRV